MSGTADDLMTLNQQIADQWKAEGCAPLVTSGPRLDAVRQRLKPVRSRARSPAGASAQARRAS